MHLRKQELFKSVLPSKLFEAAGMGKPIVLGVEGCAAEFLRGADLASLRVQLDVAVLAGGRLVARGDARQVRDALSQVPSRVKIHCRAPRAVARSDASRSSSASRSISASRSLSRPATSRRVRWLLLVSRRKGMARPRRCWMNRSAPGISSGLTESMATSCFVSSTSCAGRGQRVRTRPKPPPKY